MFNGIESNEIQSNEIQSNEIQSNEIQSNKIDLKIHNLQYDKTEINKMNTTQSKGLKRNTIDKYYTKLSVVNNCLSIFKTHITIGTNDLIIEPSAGNGAFISGIKELVSHYLFYDLEPENAEIVKQDYLEFDYKSISNLDKYDCNIHIIGNPPFGRQSSLAIKFIKKSCEFCDSISFILPKSFKKESMKSKFPLNFHLIFEEDLPDKSFLVDGDEHTVPCVFQIWQKKHYNRTVVEKVEPIGFIFVDKNDSPDISFRRVGVNAGTIDTNIESKSIQSHYFIKFTNDKSIENNIKLLSKITYNFNNTVGPKSISKPELIKEFIKVL